MSIEAQPGKRTMHPPPAPHWGELVPESNTTLVLRVALPDRIVTVPFAELRRWEHTLGEPEILTISTGREQFVIEGGNLGEVRAALDTARLCEIHPTFTRTASARLGPRIARIAIETA